MALTLNTGHALYGNLVELFAVDGGALVSLKTARTYTNRANAPTYDSGSLGNRMNVVGNGFAWSGVHSITPSPGAFQNVGSAGTTILVVFDGCGATSNYPYGEANGYGLGWVVSGSGKPFMYVQTSGGASLTSRSAQAGATITDGGAHSVACVHPGGDNVVATSYTDGVVCETGTTPGFGSYFNLAAIGGLPGYEGATMGIYYVALFDKALTQGEIAALHASLGADNAFALLTAPTGPSSVPPTALQQSISQAAGRASFY